MSAPAAVLLAACQKDPTSAIAEALDWVDCEGGLQCATLPVEGDTIAVAWHPAAFETEEMGVVLSGGPGSSSIGLLEALMENLPEADPELWAERSWIAIDNRGIGASGQIRCVDSEWFDDLRVRDPVPSTEADADAQQALRDTFQAGCLADRGADGLAALGTPTTAADLDALRGALGQPDLDLVGFSFGTWIGAVYAATYPQHAGRIVLDGVMSPLTTRDELLFSQAAGFELALERFFERCAADPECPISADPAGVFDRVLAASTEDPLPAPSDPDGRTLGRNDLRWATASLLYGPDDDLLAQGLAEADAGDATLLLEGADEGWGRDPATGDYDPTLEGYWAIGCLDLPWPAGWSDEEVWAWGVSLDTTFPRLGSSLLTGELVCSGWPVEAPPVDIAAQDAPPLLLVGGLYDPATPWVGAESMQTALANDSALLTYDGDGHVQMFTDACVYEQERAFLLGGNVPPRVSCP